MVVNQHNYGKSPFFNGKIHYEWPFSIAFCMFTRGYAHQLSYRLGFVQLHRIISGGAPRIRIYSDWPGGGALLYFLLPIAVVFLGVKRLVKLEKTSVPIYVYMIYIYNTIHVDIYI